MGLGLGKSEAESNGWIAWTEQRRRCSGRCRHQVSNGEARRRLFYPTDDTSVGRAIISSQEGTPKLLLQPVHVAADAPQTSILQQEIACARRCRDPPHVAVALNPSLGFYEPRLSNSHFPAPKSASQAANSRTCALRAADPTALLSLARLLVIVRGPSPGN